MRDFVLAEVPAEKDGLAVRVEGRKVDEPAVEVLHLDAELVELVDELGQALLGLGRGSSDTSHRSGIEAAAVSRHAPADLVEARRGLPELTARRDEPLDERAHDRQRLVRLVLGEEAHLRVE